MNKIRKIAIIGNSGSGKSTLAVTIAKRLSLPVFHLDKILWKPNWERTSEVEFIQKHNEIIEKDSWIIDGVAYKSTYKKRFDKADVILYLDISPETCFQNAKKRMLEDLERPNPYVSENCPYSIELEKEQKDVIDSFHNEYRPMILDMLEEYQNQKKVIFLKDNFSVANLINKIVTNNK